MAFRLPAGTWADGRGAAAPGEAGTGAGGLYHCL
jgi:hypothetical protein